MERNEHFLRERFGYQAIEDYLNQLTNGTIDQSLEGTLIGGFSREGVGWKNRWPRAPLIYTREDYEEEAEKKSSLKSLCGKNRDSIIIPDLIKERTHFLSNQNAFYKSNAQEVKAKLEKIKQNYFPEAQFDFGGSSRFVSSLTTKDLCIITEGPNARGKKFILVSLNLFNAQAEALNAIAHAYNKKVSAFDYYAEKARR